MSATDFVIERAPVFCNALYDARDAALAAPTGRIALGIDDETGVIINTDFDESKAAYSDAYENSLHASPTFDSWARGLAGDLASRWTLADKTVVDVGCGGGEFLALLKQAGAGRCVGFEPGRSEEAASGASARTGVEVRASAFPAGAGDLDVGFVTCRHVIEHIAQPMVFLQAIRASLHDGTGVYFEAPSGEYMLNSGAVWDVLYEHCNYFTQDSLSRLLERAGFRVVRRELLFGDQYVAVEAVADVFGPSKQDANDTAELEDVRAALRRLAQKRNEKVATWRDRLRSFHTEGKTVCIWGAGTKGVMFLCAMREAGAAGAVRFAVDLNTKKHGKYTPVAGVEVTPVARLKSAPVDLIVAMNPMYRGEIALAAQEAGCKAPVEVV